MDELTGKTSSTGASNSFSGEPYSPPNQRRAPIRFNFQLDDHSNFAERDLENDLIFLRKHLSPSTKPISLISKYFSFLISPVKKIVRKVTRKKTLEILQVVNTCQSDLKTFLWGWINPPLENDEFLGSNITVGGWVLGKTLQPVAIRCIVNQVILTEIPIDILRPDVVKTHFTHKVQCGYRATIDLADFPNESELLLQAVFPDDSSAPFGIIKYRKYG